MNLFPRWEKSAGAHPGLRFLRREFLCPRFAEVNFELLDDLSTTQTKKLVFGALDLTCGSRFLFNILSWAESALRML